MNDFNFKIGLAFSGGGFRASSFSLGTLTYLDKIKITDHTSLLDKVAALSTVSGGTITGARYAIGIKEGQSLEQIYKALYRFMTEVDMINKSLDGLGTKFKWTSGRNQNLINVFADIYDKELFNQAKFGELLTENRTINLKHISFNATEFSNALQFRFQVSEKLIDPSPGEPEMGIIGNYYYRVPFDYAKDIRMADILAASSCFPGGFEPINFPTDFGLPLTDELLQNSKNSKFPVGLMDGGIVDNQGIEPLLLAETRMTRGQKDKEKGFDLLIISDVASPYMENYIASQNPKKTFFNSLTLESIFYLNSLLLLISLVSLVVAIINTWYFLLILSTILITVCGTLFVLSSIIRSVPKNFHVPNMFLKPLDKLLKIKLSVYENLMVNRVNSLLKMTNQVFLKHVRRLNYAKIFNDPQWQNRRIMNAIYELRAGEERWKRVVTIKNSLVPSEKIQEVASVAASMGTTLWFSKDELIKKDMLNCIIATGQFTLCWNLLEYIEKLKANNTNKNHQEFIKLEEQINEHWQLFQKDPMWLVKEMNQALKK